ncbi:MAG: tryptophan 2,3-dioxygenase family protein [Chitinophagaceae bacterium]
MYYGSYLQLDKIIDAQSPESFKEGNIPAHDEMLFIIIHQAYELWFKQILFELDFCRTVFSKDRINDSSEDLNLVLHRLKRVNKILHLLNQQVEVLDTMTPLDFLAFRNLLTPSSGFQSVQFRLIEATLGLQMEERHHKDYYKRTNEGGFTQKDYQQINNQETTSNIQQLVNNWLERLPFFEPSYWTEENSNEASFIQQYQKIYKSNLTEREAGKIIDFNYVFLEEDHESLDEATKKNLRNSFSAKALRAALFITLYRDFPLFHTSFSILDTLIETDNLMATWRHKHMVMVKRMIGMRVGTGNTSGSGYLQGALNSHFIFKDLTALSTYLIERRKLPELPKALIQKLGYFA